MELSTQWMMSVLRLKRYDDGGCWVSPDVENPTLGTTLIHLQRRSTGGKILFEGRNVTHLDKKELHIPSEGCPDHLSGPIFIPESTV